MKNANTTYTAHPNRTEAPAASQGGYTGLGILVAIVLIAASIYFVHCYQRYVVLFEDMFSALKNREDRLWSEFLLAARDEALSSADKVFHKAGAVHSEVCQIRNEVAGARDEIKGLLTSITPDLAAWKEWHVIGAHIPPQDIATIEPTASETNPF